MKASEVLQQAWGIVSLSRAVGGYARNAEGKQVGVLDSEACSFCAAGAVMKVQGKQAFLAIDDVVVNKYLHRASNEVGKQHRLAQAYPTVFDINDHYPQHLEEVFKLAIAKAREDEAKDGTPTCPVDRHVEKGL